MALTASNHLSRVAFFTYFESLHGAGAVPQEDSTVPLLAVNMAAAPKLGQTGRGTHRGLFFLILTSGLTAAVVRIDSPGPPPPAHPHPSGPVHGRGY